MESDRRNSLDPLKFVSPIRESRRLVPPTPSSGKISVLQKVLTSDHPYTEAVKALDGGSLLHLLMEEAAKLPYKHKRSQGASTDTEYVEKVIQQLNSVFSHAFLKVDLNAKIRDVNDTDWTQLCACKRSDSGTTGIYFLQSMNSKKELDLIVAKPIVTQDYEKTVFVNEIASRFFDIQCPKVRLIRKTEDEFTSLEYAIRDLFPPVDTELYENGGHHSPKHLFNSQAIMLIEYVKGKPLSHRTEGQRTLSYADYHGIGKLFLLDLLIRNTDRLPCRKAMPRPGSKYIFDHGNAGNIMFGEVPGELWSIDPEMQTKVDSAREEAYGLAIESVIREIVERQDVDQRYQALEALYFVPCVGLEGVLELSLNDLEHWEELNPFRQEAVAAVLQLIRIRVKADYEYMLKRANGVKPPLTVLEKDWREFIRLVAPRAKLDIFQFLEIHSGYPTPQFASEAFESGFLESLLAAQQVKQAFDHPSSEQLKADLDPAIDLGFILRMIDRACKYCTDEVVARVNRENELVKKRVVKSVHQSGGKKDSNEIIG